ncbi:MAG: YdcF family protein [Sulfuriferula sp.]|nr:YdcF family protein [Sulfuriferula sp.]
MSWFITVFISAVLLPPLSLILLGGAGLYLLPQRPQLGKKLIAAALMLLCALSMPVISDRLLAQFEHYAAIDLAHPKTADAIVILGAGSYRDAPEYQSDTVSRYALERLRYGARLYRATRLPIAVTGGNPAGGTAEAYSMRDVLTQDFHVPVRWVEPHSNTTWENARDSRKLLPADIRTIYLVTHAWHLPRAIYAFQHAGFNVIPAGTAYSLAHHISPLDFIPQPSGLTNSYFAIHEALGLIWYRLTG